jgi:hypothetical protein
MGGSKGIEVTDGEGNRFLLTPAEIQDLLIANLKRDELDEFGGSLIIFAEFHQGPVYE